MKQRCYENDLNKLRNHNMNWCLTKPDLYIYVVARRVRHWISDPMVVGSIPLSRTFEIFWIDFGFSYIH